MKNKLYISLFAACALGFTACESDVDNFMVDDTIGLLESGVVDAQVYEGLDAVTPVYVVKAGKGKQSAVVNVTVDPEVMTAYNALSSTVLKVAEVPADCYTLTVSHLNFSADDYRKAFEIKWNMEKLEAALAENSNIVVPLRMSVETDARIADGRLTVMVRPTIAKPSMGLVNPGVQPTETPTRRDDPEKSNYYRVDINFIPDADIEYGVEADPSLVDEYNAENGTAYQLLPEDAYILENKGVIKKGLQTSYFKLNFIRTALIPESEATKFGVYLLPIRIKSLDSTPLDEGKSIIYYIVDVDAAELSKTNWSIVDCNSDLNNDPDATALEKEANGPASLIDGDTDTSWRSIYRIAQDLPYYFTVDLGKMTSLYKLGFRAPSNPKELNWHNSKAGYVEVSVDGENWQKLADWVCASRSQQQVIFPVEPVLVRYVRFYITERHRKTTGVANANMTAIGEFDAWGEVATWIEEETTETPEE